MNGVVPPQLRASAMHKQVLERFARLFERQVRMHQFADSINALVASTHDEILDVLQDSMRNIDALPLRQRERDRVNAVLDQTRTRCHRLEQALELLLGERERIWSANGDDLRHVMLETNLTAQMLTQTLAELEYHSTHDPLTGLHNRRYFNEILQYEIDRSARHQHEFSLVMLDLDDFKEINDSYGHPCGDAVLIDIAGIMRDCVRKDDFVTRTGGDEFIILLTETGVGGAQLVAEKIRRRIRSHQFRNPDGAIFHLTASLGVVSYPQHARSLDDLLAGVDTGLYSAKARGKDGIITLDAVHDVLESNRCNRAHVERLRSSLKSGDVLPFFQPIVDCNSGAVMGFECLARMREPDGAISSANMFVAAMEKHGLGRDLDRTMIRQSLQALRQGDAQPSSLKLFINLSAREIHGRGVLGYAERACAELEISPHNIVFEIMERDAIEDMAHMRRFLANLRGKGFQFALDDFGSGYNSFHYLRELQFDYIKIDGAFVRNILTSTLDHALVRNLSRLCSEIGALTIAEFVESEPLMQRIRELGIDYAQGYHIGRPAPRMMATG